MKITINPDVCNGKPVIEGTRITVQTILEFLGAGDSAEDILESYPSLKAENITDCIKYASDLMGNQYVIKELG